MLVALRHPLLDRSRARSAGLSRPPLSLPFSLLLAAVIASSAAAAAWSEEPPPQFLIEKISVTGVSKPAAREITISQSLLKPGQSYGERQLREAVYRVKRLPFVLDADFTLRKGSERGTFELVIAVEQNKPVFLDYSVTGTYSQSRPGPHGSFEVNHDVTAGARAFVGQDGLLFASATSGFLAGAQGPLQVGYTRYNLFGNDSFASVAVGTNSRLNNHPVVASGSVGLPLTGNNSLRADLTWSLSNGGPLLQHSRTWGADLQWLYRTTDNPVFPTRGIDFQARVSDAWETLTGLDFLRAAQVRQQVTSPGIAVSAIKYFPLGRRQSVAVGLASGAFRETLDLTSMGAARHQTETAWGAGAGLGHNLELWSGPPARRIGDLWLESAVNFSWSDLGFSTAPAFGRVTASTGLVLRNEWGIVRASFAFAGREMR
ncbi:MAG TPA: hypothetical protein VHR45_05440 [Thermoanaerobaculia bacterium]|nr:hypothetical protein [Thermoanaerobaculia bacterium]